MFAVRESEEQRWVLLAGGKMARIRRDAAILGIIGRWFISF